MTFQRHSFFAGLGVVLAVLAVYGGTWHAPFHFDDGPAILDNETIRHVWPLSAVLSPPRDFGTTVNGRPLLNLSLAVNYAIGRTDVVGYHAVNLAIHLLAALTLFGIVRRTFRKLDRPHATAAGFTTAVIWAVHPLQTESVTYLIQRAEALAALCTLLTLYAFIRGIDSPVRPRWFVLSIASCFAGVLTKETAAIAPVLVLLYDGLLVSHGYGQAWRARRWYYTGLLAAWCVLAVFVATSNDRGGTAGFGSGLPWWRYAETQLGAIIRYLVLAVWPAGQTFDYGYSIASGFAEIWLPGIGIVALLALTVSALQRWPSAGFAAASFFLLLAPSSSVVPIATQTMAEHRMYLPLAALTALVAGGAVVWFGRRAWWAIVPVAVLLGWLTIERNRVYGSELSLWQDTVAKAPDNARAQNNLGKAMIESGDTDAAMRCFAIALKLLPDYPETHNNVGYALAQSGRLTEAVAHYEQSLRLRPTNARAHDNLGNALLQLDRAPEALAHFEAALQLQPNRPDTLWGQGNALVQLGRAADALAAYERALQLDPRYAEAHYGMAVALGHLGRTAEAAVHYDAALQLKPNFPEAHNNLGNLLVRDGKFDAATAQYRAALALKPDYTEGRVNLANSLLESGHAVAAISEYESVLRTAPENVDARFGLGNALAQSGQMAQAIVAFRAVLDRAPKHVGAHVNLGGALLVTGHIADAVHEYEAAAQLQPDDAQLRALVKRARDIAARQ